MLESPSNPQQEQDFWEDLLYLVEQGEVIPVVGWGMVTRGDDGQLLQPWLAQRLAAMLQIPAERVPPGCDLNAVAVEHLRGRGDRNAMYTRLARILQQECPPPGQALRDLASISAFNLFLTMTFDPLLQQALDAVRYDGDPCTVVHAYSPRMEPTDLPARRRDLSRATVFHLLGRVSGTPQYVVWEEDLLEHLFGLDKHMPVLELLGRDLKEHGLLFLGLNFSDWLLRFLLRLSKQTSLLAPLEHHAVLADGPGDELPQSLVVFCEAVNRDIRVRRQDPIEFCAELARRWRLRHPPDAKSLRESLPPVPAVMPPGALFVSYAHEDEPAVAAIVCGLQAAGCSVWYDRHIQPAAKWERTLEEGVTQRCGLFLSVISRTTEGARESYYHLERYWAEVRAKRMAPGEEFYIPVVIDDASLPAQREPWDFQKVQATRLPGGQVTDEFARRVRELQLKVLSSPP